MFRLCLFIFENFSYLHQRWGKERRTIHNINGRLLARLERTRIMIKFASWFAFEWFNEYKFEMVDLFITSVVPRSCRLLNGRQIEKTPEDNNLIKDQVWTRGQKNLFLKFVVFSVTAVWKRLVFSPKNSEKIRAPKIRSAFFFFLNSLKLCK